MLHTTHRSARATLTDGSDMTVLRLGLDDEGRSVYRWYVRNTAGHVLETGADLRTGVGMDHGPARMLATLCSFLTACAESRAFDGENADLFGEAVGLWAEEHDAEITTLQYEIEEGNDE